MRVKQPKQSTRSKATSGRRGARDRRPGGDRARSPPPPRAPRPVTAPASPPRRSRWATSTRRAALAGSTFAHAGDGFNARIKAENAKGGVNGRKIDRRHRRRQRHDQQPPSLEETRRERQRLRGGEQLVVRVPRATATCSSNGVPMVGGGYDGNEYGQPGNEKLISILGNIGPVYGAQYTPGFVQLMKKAGATKVGVVSYGASASSTAAAQNLQKYAVPAAGLDPAYTNTTVEFGTTDVGPLVLGMKNAGVDATYLPLVLSSNLAIIQNAAQNDLQVQARGARHRVRPVAARRAGVEDDRTRGAVRADLGTGRAQERGDQEVPGRPEEVRRLRGRARLRRLHRLPHRRSPRARACRPRGRTSPATASSPRPRASGRGTRPASAASRST